MSLFFPSCLSPDYEEVVFGRYTKDGWKSFAKMEGMVGTHIVVEGPQGVKASNRSSIKPLAVEWPGVQSFKMRHIEVKTIY